MAQQDGLPTVVGGMASLVVEKPVGCDARVVSYELVPTVCHVAATGETRVYLLDDYTDELAAEHRLSDPDDPLTVDLLRQCVPEGL